MSRQFPGDYADPMAMVSSPHPNMMTFKLNKNPLTVSTPPQTTWSPKPEAALQVSFNETNLTVKERGTSSTIHATS